MANSRISGAGRRPLPPRPGYPGGGARMTDRTDASIGPKMTPARARAAAQASSNRMALDERRRGANASGYSHAPQPIYHADAPKAPGIFGQSGKGVQGAIGTGQRGGIGPVVRKGRKAT